jgi:hypothetical protein
MGDIKNQQTSELIIFFPFFSFLYKPDHPSTSAIENEIEIDPTIFPFHLRRPVFSRDTGQSYSAEWNTLPQS